MIRQRPVLILPPLAVFFSDGLWRVTSLSAALGVARDGSEWLRIAQALSYLSYISGISLEYVTGEYPRHFPQSNHKSISATGSLGLTATIAAALATTITESWSCSWEMEGDHTASSHSIPQHISHPVTPPRYEI